MTNHLGAVEKSEHGPTEARAQRLFDGTDCFTAECLLKAAFGGICCVALPLRSTRSAAGRVPCSYPRLPPLGVTLGVKESQSATAFEAGVY